MDKALHTQNTSLQKPTRDARKSSGSNAPVPIVGGFLRANPYHEMFNAIRIIQEEYFIFPKYE